MCIKRILPSRVALQHEETLVDSKSDTVQDDSKINCVLTLEEKYNKCIIFQKEGKTQTEICNLLNMDCRVYKKLMLLSQKEVCEYFSTVADRNCSLALLNKMEKVKYVRDLHAKGYSNRKIARLTGFSKVTVAKYLDKDFSPIRKENTRDRISILRPYVAEIEKIS